MKKTYWIIKGLDRLFDEEYVAKDKGLFETHDEAFKRCKSNEWTAKIEIEVGA